MTTDLRLKFWIPLLAIILSSCHRILTTPQLIYLKEFSGKERLWIHNITHLDKNSFIVTGAYVGDLTINDTTIKGDSGYRRYLSLWVNDSPKKTVDIGKTGACTPYTDNQKNIIITGSLREKWTNVAISKFDRDLEEMWRKEIELSNPIKNNISQLDLWNLCFDDKNNIYALVGYRESVLKIDQDLYEGDGVLLIKYDQNGNMLFRKKISSRLDGFQILRYSDNLIYAYGREEAIFNLNGEISTKKSTSEIIRYDIHSNNNDDYHRMTSNNSYPEVFKIEKYKKNKKLEATKLPNVTSAHTRNVKILDFTKRKMLLLVTEYPIDPAGTGLSSNFSINISLITKKNYSMKKVVTFKYSRVHERPSVTFIGKSLYIAGTYFDNAIFDNIKLSNFREYPSNESAILVKYRFKR